MEPKFAVKQSVDVRHSNVSIRPFVSGRFNFGLERYGMVVADGVKHRCPITVTGTGAIKEYITGLNENSAAMKELATQAKHNKEKKEEYEAKVREIRTIVARAEREITANFEIDPDNIDITDNTFWSKVKTFQSIVPDTFDHDNKRKECYWDTVVVEVNNHGIAMKEDNIKDLLIIKAIEAGGVALIAPSYEAAVASNYHKFYLDKRINSSKTQISTKKQRDMAGAELLKLYNNDANKLFYVTKLVSLDSLYYKKGNNATPIDVLYDECSRYLDGEGMIKSKQEAVNKFLEICKMEMEELIYRCMIQDGSRNKYLSYKPDGMIYHMATNAPLGKTIPDCIVYLKDPINDDICKALKAQVEKEWTS